jgi:hypothetical protein
LYKHQRTHVFSPCSRLYTEPASSIYIFNNVCATKSHNILPRLLRPVIKNIYNKIDCSFKCRNGYCWRREREETKPILSGKCSVCHARDKERRRYCGDSRDSYYDLYGRRQSTRYLDDWLSQYSRYLDDRRLLADDRGRSRWEPSRRVEMVPRYRLLGS